MAKEFSAGAVKKGKENWLAPRLNEMSTLAVLGGAGWAASFYSLFSLGV